MFIALTDNNTEPFAIITVESLPKDGEVLSVEKKDIVKAFRENCVGTYDVVIKTNSLEEYKGKVIPFFLVEQHYFEDIS